MRKRKPDELKDSGIQWIGQIPISWSVYKLGYYSYLKGRVGWHGLTTEEYQETGPFLVTGTDFSNGEVSWNSCHHISVERYEQDEYIQLKEGDLLITKDGTIGKTAIVNGLDGRATLNTGVFLVRPLNDSYTTRFLYWILNSSVFDEYIEFSKTGSTVAHLYQETFSNWKFPVPKLSQQKVIATFLDHKTQAIDLLIEKKQQLIEKLKEKRQALITQAVTKGLNPEAPMKDSGIEWLGEIPEHWDLVKFKHSVTLITEKSDDADFIIALENLESWTGKYVETDSNYNPSGISFKADDVLFGKLRPYLAKGYLADKPGNAIGDFYVFRGKKYLPEYLKMIILSEAFIDVVDSSTYGAKMPRASWDFIGDMKIPVPAIDEQQLIIDKVNKHIDSAVTIRNRVESQIGKLKEYRQSLISAAVTGKIDVREEVQESNEAVIDEWEMSLVLLAYIIDELDRRNIFFGKLMVIKCYIVAHYITEMAMKHLNVRRFPMGPHDPEFFDKTQDELQERDWIDVSQSSKVHGKYEYKSKHKGEVLNAYKKMFGDKNQVITDIIELFVQKGAKNAEVLATTYSAWNDLIIWGAEASEENILNEILVRWPGNKKRKVPIKEWKSCIQLLKKRGLEPKGYGKATINQPNLI